VNGNAKAARADVVLAAGGLIWRESARGPELAVVHRPQHGDWTLPKGKLDPGERWQDAALREVEEETGLHVELGDFAGASAYMTNRAPKVVLYWHMLVVGDCKFDPDDPGEVDALEWLLVPAARKRLSYERDRKVLDDAIALSTSEPADENGKASIGSRLRAALHRHKT
jgi:8-oxo-dGTP diphosphatase